MTAEEIKSWQAEHLTPAIKAEAEGLAKEYEKHDIARYGLLERIVGLAGLMDEYPAIIETEEDVDKRISLGVKAGDLLGVHITDNHIDTLHTFCGDCGRLIPENEETWSYQDEDGNRYCRHCKHNHIPKDED